MPKKHSLSFLKFEELLRKKSYILISIYSLNKECLFAQVKTPAYQKTFFIGIPKKYSMPLKNVTAKVIEIVEFPTRNKIQEDHLMEVKGPLLNCDLISMASSRICVYRNFNFEYFKIKSSSRDDESDEEIDNVSKIIHEAKSLVPEFETTSQRDGDHSEDGSSMSEGDGRPIEIVFDENEHEVEDEMSKFIDNSLPENLEECDLNVGIIYALIDISSFYKRASEYEQDILNTYAILEDMEDEYRKRKKEALLEGFGLIKLHIKERFEQLAKSEKIIKDQITKLAQVISSMEEMKKKKIEEKTFEKVSSETEKLIHRSRHTMNELNLTLIKNKDELDDFLALCENFINDVLENKNEKNV